MTPEEIEELRALVGRLCANAYDKNLAVVLGAALEHIDQQAASLDEAEALTRRNVELINGYMARITELEAQVAALREIAISERERHHISDMSRFGFVLDSDACPDPRKLAEDQLSEEHPGAFR